MAIACAMLAAIAATAFATTNPPSFLLAVDASSIGSLDCDGSCPPFRWDTASPPSDALAQLARAGVNTVRIRLWNSPVPSAAYANLTGVLRLARRVTSAGMAVWIDPHYSDTWADPSHQTKPAAWRDLSPSGLAAAVYNYTFSAVAALVAQGTPPALVQVGNEIDNGLLWNDAGQPCSQGGRVEPPCTANFAALGALVAAGQRAVRAAAPGALVAIQSYKGSHFATTGAAEIVAFLTQLAAHGAGDFDVVGASFYPEADPCPCDTSNLTKLGVIAEAFPGKKVAVFETSYPFSDNTGALKPGQFPYTQAGQASFLTTAVATVRSVTAGYGVAWWGTEIIRGYGLGLTALWDEAGVGTLALRGGWQS